MTATLQTCSFGRTVPPCSMLSVVRSLLAISLAALLISPTWAVPINGGLQLWLDGRDTSTMFQEIVGPGATASGNGDPVGVWRDKSGNGYHAIATALGSRAVRNDTALNGGTAIRLDNVDDQLLVSTLSVSRPYTVIVVDQYNTALQGRTVDAAVNWLVGKHAGVNRFYNGANFVGPDQAATVNVPDIQTDMSTTSPNESRQIFNGTDITNNPTAGVNPGQLRIGTGFSERSNFDIAELIVYNRGITVAERTITENYLSAKYSGAVASHLRTITNNRYIGDDQAKGHYDFGVFGIGQATNGSIVTTGTTDGLSITQSGADLLGSDEWVLAGHTNGSNGVTSLDVPSNQMRWERSWFIDTTGVTSADLTFDWDEADNQATFDPGYYGLYYRLNNSGPFSLLGIGTVDIGNQRVSFLGAPLDLNDGYYTLGTVPVPEPATATMLAFGLVGLAIRSRRRKVAA